MRTSVPADDPPTPADAADYYVRVPVKLLELGPFAVAVYSVLCDYANKNTGVCWPSHATIAKRAGVSVSKAQRVLIELREAGWVTWSSRDEASGAKVLSNCYVVHRSPQRSVPDTEVSVRGTDISVPDTEVSVGHTEGSVPGTEGVGTSYRGGSVPRTEELITIEPQPTEPSLSTVAAKSRGDSPEFVRFWQAYPRKQDKGSARKAWAKAIKAADVAEIIAGAERYRDDPNRDPGFTKLPATWLNAESWDNDPLPERSGSPPKPPSASRMFADASLTLATLEIAQ